jgi:hypothetical protein
MNYSPNQGIVPLNLVSFPTSFDTKHTITENTFRQPKEDYPFMKIRVLQNSFAAVAQMTMFSNDYVASNVARTTFTAACQILFDGQFKFSRVVNRPSVAPFWPPTLGDICSGQNMSFASSALELRGKISSVSGSVINVTANVEDLIFGGPVKLTMVHLYHNPILRNAAIYRPRNPTTDFIYLEDVSRTNIERADLEWSVLRIGSLPVIESQTYRFMQGSEFWTLVAPLQYNISVNTITNPSVGPSQEFVFHETPCNALCVPQNKLMEQCVSRASCYCTPPFSGPLCACDTRLLPAGVTCSEEEGKAWVLSGDMSLSSGSSVTIPKETVLQVDGNMNISGDVYLGESSGIVATGVILQNGVLKATCKLVERLTPRGCLVHPTINIHSNSFIFLDLTAIELTLDISDLSTDGSCQNPASLSLDDLKASMFFSYNNTLMSSEASWTIRLDTGSDRDEKKFEKLSFRTEILSSSDRSASLGTTTKLATSSTSSKSCATIEQPVGALSLVVAPCKEKKVQWWWYGAPIIAVTVIVVITLVIVFSVKSVREAVIPYHKSEGQI